MNVTVAFIIVATMVYLAVAFFTTDRKYGDVYRKPIEHQPKHAAEPTYEQQAFQLLIDSWLKGEEQWVKYALVETWPMTQSWL